MDSFARSFTTLFAFTAIGLTASAAAASPWTVPKDKLLLSLNYDFAFAQNEFLADGTYQSYPLEGRFTSSTLRIGGRYGFTSRFELAAELTVKTVTYSADPIIIALPDEPDPIDLPAARASVTDFSNTLVGPADLFLTGRYNFVRGLFAFANETRLKLPTGYEKPSGTFTETFEVDDDLALGDGQTDLEDSLLFGVFVPMTKTFGRADVGFRLRFGGPGHQAIGALRIGQFVGQHVVLFAGSSATYTVTKGDVIGQTFVSNVDDLQAADVEVGVNTIPVDFRLDKDFLHVEGGVLFLPSPGVELQASYSQIIWGANVAAIQSVSIGTAIHFDNLTAESEE